MKLTKRKALEICRDLWKWLAKTGNRTKYDWPGWKRHGHMECSCPCCEFSGTDVFGYYKCKRCPLKALWPTGLRAGNAACQKSDNSPWQLWRTSKTDNQRKDAATIIATACTKELRKMKGKR